jgi:hypothetical protein
MLNNGNANSILISLLPNSLGRKIKIEAGSFIYDDRWINYKSKVLDIEQYITNSLGKNRPTYFYARNNALALLVGIDYNGKLLVEEGPQVPYKSNTKVPFNKISRVLPIFSLILIQDGSVDLNLGIKEFSDKDIINISGIGNILKKDIQGETGSISSARGEQGAQGVTGYRGIQGPQGPTGLLGVQGTIGASASGITGFQGLTGLNYRTTYDDGLEIYLKMNEDSDTQIDYSGNSRNVEWTTDGISYRNRIDAILCEGQSVANINGESSFLREDLFEYAIASNSGTMSCSIFLESLPTYGNKSIIAEFIGTDGEFIFYVDSFGNLVFEDEINRYKTNSPIINTNTWVLVEFQKIQGVSGSFYITTSTASRTQVPSTRTFL